MSSTTPTKEDIARLRRELARAEDCCQRRALRIVQISRETKRIHDIAAAALQALHAAKFPEATS